MRARKNKIIIALTIILTQVFSSIAYATPVVISNQLSAAFNVGTPTITLQPGESIQAAIDSVTVDGTTIVLAAGGSYTGDIRINKNITLKSADTVSKAVLTGSIELQNTSLNSVAIEGLRIVASGQNPAISTAAPAGNTGYSYGTLTIRDNEIDASGNGLQAVYLRASDTTNNLSVKFTNLLIQGNQMIVSGNEGVGLFSDFDSANILENTITGDGDTKGLKLYRNVNGSRSITVQGNTFTNHAYGVYFNDGKSNFTVNNVLTKNTFSQTAIHEWVPNMQLINLQWNLGSGEISATAGEAKSAQITTSLANGVSSVNSTRLAIEVVKLDNNGNPTAGITKADFDITGVSDSIANGAYPADAIQMLNSTFQITDGKLLGYWGPEEGSTITQAVTTSIDFRFNRSGRYRISIYMVQEQ